MSILSLAEALFDYGRCLAKKGDSGGAKGALEESRTLYSRLNDVKNTRLIEDLLGRLNTEMKTE